MAEQHSTTALRIVKPWQSVTRRAVEDYRLRHANAQAKERVRCLAVSRGHALGLWREDPARTDSGLVLCRDCGAGASLDLLIGEESISDSLRASCPGVPFSLTRTW